MAVRPILRPAVWTEEESSVTSGSHQNTPYSSPPPVHLHAPPPPPQPHYPVYLQSYPQHHAHHYPQTYTPPSGHHYLQYPPPPPPQHYGSPRYSHPQPHQMHQRPRPSPPRERETHDLSDPEYPPKKKKKIVGTSAAYYPPSLNPSERVWRDRSSYLYQRGYQLRPRYQPSWSPTKLGNSRHHHSGEDHIMQILPQVLDAIRRQDGLVVCLKLISEPKKAHQIKIIEYFSSRKMTEDSRNHVVPFYDAFPDSFYPNMHFIAMPVMRRFDDPEFMWVGEVVGFVTQVVEGLVFLHENNIAHHNIIGEHIMMDAKALVPTGWHFVAHFCEPDGMAKIAPLERRSHPARYYYIGFGNCLHVAPDGPKLISDIGGIDEDAPELFKGKPYDPFKYDVYTLGNVFLKDLFKKFANLDFLSQLITFMRNSQFEKRPSSAQVLASWKLICSKLDLDALDDTQLDYREGMRPSKIIPPSPSGGKVREVERDRDAYSEASTSSPASMAGSGKARSDKRDISSILNTVGE